jgi:hypothetical protein
MGPNIERLCLIPTGEASSSEFFQGVVGRWNGDHCAALRHKIQAGKCDKK